MVGVLLVITALSRLYLAQDHPTDIVAGVILGVAVPLAAFRLLTPNDVYPVRYKRGRPAHLDVTGSRGEAIIRALQDQLGLIASEVKPFGLAGSGGSTPLRITVKGDPDTYVFGKLYAATHVRSDRWYKLGPHAALRPAGGRAAVPQRAPAGPVRGLRPARAVRRGAARGAPPGDRRDHPGAGVPAGQRVLRRRPRRSARPTIDEGVIDQGLAVVRRMWEIGLAHRDIKPANLMVRDGTLFVIDTAFAEVRPSPWRQAVDLANMMLVLGLRTSAEQVYARARRQFSDEEIAEAFAATRGLTMPSQLRRMLRQQGKDLHGDFLKLLPYRLPPIRIQRWTWRRVVLTVATLFGGAIALSLILGNLLGSPL